jgi:DNA-binding MarR family transcriptional regulator
LYDLIKESFLLLDFGDRRFLEAYGLTVSRYYALTHIAADPGLSPSRLSNRMFCDKSNITRLLQSLEADGYVERQAHERDGRLHRLYLSPAGTRLQQEIRTAHEAYISRRLRALEPDQVDQLSGALHRLNHQLALDLREHLPASVN